MALGIFTSKVFAWRAYSLPFLPQPSRVSHSSRVGGVVRLHESHRAEDGRGDPQLADVTLDPPLRLPVGDLRASIRAADGRVHQVWDPRAFRRVGDVFPLLDLSRRPGLPPVLHAEHATDTGHRADERGNVLQVPGDDLDAARGERLGRRLGGAPAERSHRHRCPEQTANRGSALSAGRAGDENGSLVPLGHGLVSLRSAPTNHRRKTCSRTCFERRRTIRDGGRDALSAGSPGTHPQAHRAQRAGTLQPPRLRRRVDRRGDGRRRAHARRLLQLFPQQERALRRGALPGDHRARVGSLAQRELRPHRDRRRAARRPRIPVG